MPILTFNVLLPGCGNNTRGGTEVLLNLDLSSKCLEKIVLSLEALGVLLGLPLDQGGPPPLCKGGNTV